MRTFRAVVESLEQRRLLAGDTDQCWQEPPAAIAEPGNGIAMSLSLPSQIAGVPPSLRAGVPPSAANGVPSGLGLRADASPMAQPWMLSPNLMETAGDLALVVNQNDGGSGQLLWGIRENKDGSDADIAFRIELDSFRAEKLLVDGERLLIVGQKDLFLEVGPNAGNVDAVSAKALVPGANSPDRVFLPHANDKQVIAVDLKTGEVVKELTLSPGELKYASFIDGKATLVLHRYDLVVPAIWPPIETSDEVIRFNWDAEVGSVRKDTIPSGTLAVSGNRVVVGVPVYKSDAAGDNISKNDQLLSPSAGVVSNDPARLPLVALPSYELRSFELTDSEVKERGKVDLGTQRLVSLSFHPDGETVSAVSIGGYFGETLIREPQSTEIRILDVTGETLEEIDRIDLPGPMATVGGDGSYVLLQDFTTGDMTLVDLNSDKPSDQRVHSVTLESDRLFVGQPIRVDGDKIIFLATVAPIVLPLDSPRDGSLLLESTGGGTPVNTLAGKRDPNGLPQVQRDVLLVTVSLADGTSSIQTLPDLQAANDLTVIDAESGRIGFLSHLLSATGEPSRAFVYGKINDDGKFIIDGKVTDLDWFQSVKAEPSRLLVLSPSRLSVYDYENSVEPLYTVRLTDPDAPPLQAEDDSFEFYRVEREAVDQRIPSPVVPRTIVDVLANDQIPSGSKWETRITELIGAPDSIGIVDGKYLAIDPTTLGDTQSLSFRYRVTDGETQSEAAVELSFKVVTDELRSHLTELVRNQAAKDLKVAAEKVDVEFDVRDAFNRWIVAGNKTSQPATPTTSVVQSGTSQNPGVVKEQSADPEADQAAHSTLVLLPHFLSRVTVPGKIAIYDIDVLGNVRQLSVRDLPIEEPKVPLVALSLGVTDQAGLPVTSIEVGKEFWLEFRGDDLRDIGKGVFSAFLSLEVSDRIEFLDVVEAGPEMTLIGASTVGERIQPHAIRNLGVIDSDAQSGDGQSQMLLRIRAKATKVGVAEFSSRGNSDGNNNINPTPFETLVFGSEKPLDEANIVRTGARLEIVDPVDSVDEGDVDGDGDVRANDALRIINMISRHGVGTIPEIKGRMEAKAKTKIQGEATPTIDVARYDVNRSGSVTALDALVVINRIAKLKREASGQAGKSAALAETTAEAMATPPIAANADELDPTRRRRR